MNLHEGNESHKLMKAALTKGKPMFGFVKGDVDGHEFHGNQYSGGGGSGESHGFGTDPKTMSYKEAVSEHNPVSAPTKLTIQRTASELKARGFTLGKPTMGKDFKVAYEVTDKVGNSKLVGAKHIEAFLNGKTKEL